MKTIEVSDTTHQQLKLRSVHTKIPVKTLADKYIREALKKPVPHTDLKSA